MRTVTKKIFLKTISCPTLGWLAAQEPSKEPLSISERFRMEEGLEIHDRARNVFKSGYLVQGDNPSAAEQTGRLIKDNNIPVIFEGTFLCEGFVAKADILKREESGWHIIEVKSKSKGEKELKGKDKDELVDDMAYTAMLTGKASLKINACSLMLISKDYRLGMSHNKLFTEVDYTREVIKRATEYSKYSDDVLEILSKKEKPAPELKWECKNCEKFKECLGKGIDNHIFDLPRLSQKKFCELIGLGALRIEDVEDDFTLTPNQIIVENAVKRGQVIINQDRLKDALYSVVFPAYYLDFETIRTAIPLYPNIAPYTQIPIQYSLHICTTPDDVLKHLQYLGDPMKDPRREFAERLISDCGTEGSIIVYTHFEKDRIKELLNVFPDLESHLTALVDRMIDINKIVSDNFYHPDFHGSYSIKNVLPVLVPDLSYEDMDVSNGLDASATFAYMAKEEFDSQEADEKKQQLLEYCKLDTLAMVRLHECLIEWLK